MNTVDLIFNYVKENEYIDGERLAYGWAGDYPFSLEEYNVLWDYLEAQYQEEQDDCTAKFTETRLYLEYKGEQYIWRMLVGQGTACQIFIGNAKWDKLDAPFEFKEDKKVILPDNLYDFMEKEYDKLIIKEIIE